MERFTAQVKAGIPLDPVGGLSSADQGGMQQRGEGGTLGVGLEGRVVTEVKKVKKVRRFWQKTLSGPRELLA